MPRCQGHPKVLRSALLSGLLSHAEVPRCPVHPSGVEECSVDRFTRLCQGVGAEVLRSSPRPSLLSHVRYQGRGPKEFSAVRFTWSCQSAKKLTCRGHSEVLWCRGAEECSMVGFTRSCRDVRAEVTRSSL
ncbi:hypothetical protein NE237_029312 [Protea cynaroides]|uniref:Uncharacterized protein n=1 Tax=Protea cynaroides TaxID=273540 RepID=A0A9Q0GU18_9MAGN|nr:hypothetical protein NE237_029312 [Protea cynaroides]